MTDADGDGYGDINGFNSGTDCDDSDPGINPAATESSNGVDDNCDGQIDEGSWDGLVYFDNCAQTGPSGPSQAACDRIYGGTTLDGLVTVSAGIQYWTVPSTGTYEIYAAGAQGGGSGGYGALMSGSFQLQAGDVLKIVVGQMGSAAPASVGNGGGGGTFVAFSDNTPIIVAGGGGGTGHNNSYSGNNTLNGVTSTGGVTGIGGNPGAGGSNGNGGAATNGNSNTANAAGGGGFYGDGGSSNYGAGE